MYCEKPGRFLHAKFVSLGESENDDVKYLLLEDSEVTVYTWPFRCGIANIDAARSEIVIFP